jgi:DNA repair protein RadC
MPLSDRTGRRRSSVPRAVPISATRVRVRTRRFTFHVLREPDGDLTVGDAADTAASAIEIARHVIGDAITEVLIALFLDARHRTLGFAEIARGTLNATRFTAKDVLIPALYANASGIVLAHNHPSGDPSPSSADRSSTTALRRATEAIGMTLVDHLIVTDRQHYSFAEALRWPARAGGGSEVRAK